MNTAITKNKQTIFAAKHVGSFLLLIFLATFRPTSIWPNFPISLEPITVLAIGLLLLYKINATIGFKAFYEKYKVELLLLTAYFSVCFLSLYLNRNRYADTNEIIRYGIIFIVITASFPAAIFLFLLPQNEKGLSLSRFKFSGYLPWLYFALLALMAIWQYTDFEYSKSIGQFFVASEIWPTKSINSFFRVRTDLGPILALAIIIIFNLALTSINNKRPIKIIAILFIAIIFIAGIVCGSRMFLLILAFYLLLILFQVVRYSLKSAMVFSVFILAITHILILVIPFESAFKLSSFLPYILSFHQGEVIFISDIFPNISLGVFSERLQLWETAIELIKEDLFIGTSNGVFRLSITNSFQNTHSLILQSLIDAGFLGSLILIMLLWIVIKRLKLVKLPKVIIFLIFCSLLFDYQIDHSLPWIITTSFLLSITLMHKKVFNVGEFMGFLKYPSLSIKTLQFSILILILCSISYFIRYENKQSLTLDQRLMSYFSSRNTKNIVLLDNRIEFTPNLFKEKSIQRNIYSRLINPIDIPKKGCMYKYLNNQFMEISSSSNQLIKANNLSFNGSNIREYSSNDINCEDFKYVSFKNIANEKWISDKRIFIYRNDRTDWPIVKQANLYSVIFKIEQGKYQFKLQSRGKFALGAWPALKVSFHTVDESQGITTRFLNINSSEKKEYSINFTVNKDKLGYLEISYINDRQDPQKKEDRNVWIYPKHFEIKRVL